MFLLSLIPAPYKLLGAAIAIVAVLGSTYAKGRHDANASWQLKWDAENGRVASEQLAEADRQAKASVDIMNAYNAKQEKDASDIDGLTGQLEALHQAIAKRPGRGACKLSADDVERLLRLGTAPQK